MSEVLNDDERLNKALAALRKKIRDTKGLNRLLLGQYESSDEELKQCVVEALLDWSATPPLLGPVTLATHPAKHLLLDYAAILALTSAGIWHSREHMPSSDGGTSGDDHAKAAEYSGWIERLTAEYERKKDAFKVAQNIAAALGDGMGIQSEYAMNLHGMLW